MVHFSSHRIKMCAFAMKTAPGGNELPSQLGARSVERLKSGLRQLAQKHYETVHRQALAMIKADVNDPVPYCLLANIAADHGNHTKACELFERAAALAPEVQAFQAYHGKALTTLGRQNEAKAAADRAAGQIANDALIADMIGVIYSRTGFHEKAVPFFQRAVSLNPKPANFHYNLAASQQFLGDFDQAEVAYQETIVRDKKAYRAWSSLVGLKRQTEANHHLDKLIPLFNELSQDADGSLHLGHAIAKTLEDLGRYEESLEWLHAAKRIKRTSFSTSQGTNPGTNPGTNQIAYKDLFETAKSSKTVKVRGGRDSSAPIFVIGLPRTGTTLIDRILSSHTGVASAGELNVFPGLIKQASGTSSNMVLDAETMIKADELDLAAIGEAYIEGTREYSQGAKRMTDKMPLNFFYAGLIHRALPNAHIIALRRGSMDSCLSNYRQLLTVQDSYYRYTYDLEAIAAFYRQFDELMTFWREHLPADRFLEVHYEDMVLDQEVQTRRLLEFCDLEWEEACLRFHENKAAVSTASSVQVRQQLYSGSIGRWQRYGDKLDVLKSALGDLAS
jgi:tetratricopeptide (TPR) repeat protein